MGILQVISLVISWSIVITIQYDTNGYIVYCPCMGRFGNQADHFLGVLGFSKKVNRTLILPPWVEFRYGEATSRQVPFDTYFKVEPLSTYHRIITMELFMSSIALIIWPESKRISFCYMKRNGDQENSCNAKSGNPFGPFWDTYGIDFVGSEFYGPLNYDADSDSMVEKWKVQYPPQNWPVLAFAGAPAAFPVQQKNVALQKYMSWSDDIENKAKLFIKKHLYGGGFLGIHLRNGQDWTRACQHVQDSPTLFAAPQCVGYRNEKGPLTMAMCLPQKKEIIRQVKRALRKINDIKSIFVASDSNHMIEELNASLHSMDITVIKYPISHPHVDLAMLGRANYFIGNCVSSFSAFVKRERDVRGLPSEFWSFPTRKKPKHEEL